METLILDQKRKATLLCETVLHNCHKRITENNLNIP